MTNDHGDPLSNCINWWTAVPDSEPEDEGIKRSYDDKCYDLAVYFLSEENSLKPLRELAQHIQDAVEDWLYGHEKEPKE